MLLAQVTEAIPLIDRAASASDRWLFLAALAIIIVGGIFAIRWLVTSLTAKDAAAIAERTARETAQAKERSDIAAVHHAERTALIAEIKAEHLECRQARKEDQALFLTALEKKDAALLANTKALETLCASLDRRAAPHS